jgi:hypothetical protein
LQGLINRLYSMGLSLISVNYMPPAGSTTAGSMTSVSATAEQTGTGQAAAETADSH